MARTPSPPNKAGTPPKAPQTPPPRDRTGTLLQILQRVNPSIVNKWDGVSYKNTESKGDHFDRVVLDDEHPSVQPWTDFTFSAIYLAYGHLLDQKMLELEPNYQRPLTPSPGQKVGHIVDEASVDRYGSDWTRHIVRAPIRATARQLRPVVSPNRGTATEAAVWHQPISWTVPDTKSRMKPDWVSLCSSSLCTICTKIRQP